MRKLILLICFVLFNLVSYSQAEKTTIVILKGSALVEKSDISDIHVRKSQRVNLPKNSVLTLQANSAAIAYNSKVKIELGGNYTQKLTYTEIIDKLKNTKAVSQSRSFINYLDKIYIDIENRESSLGGTVGASSRGIGEQDLEYIPSDTSLILSDSLVLIFGSESTKLISNIVVTNLTTNEVVYDFKAIKNSIALNNLKPGGYTWNYTIESKGSKFDFSNTFTVPNLAIKTQKIKEILYFKAYLNNCEGCFTEDAKKILLNDFFVSNKFYY